MRQLVSVHPLLRAVRRTALLSSLSSLVQSRAQPRDGAAHIQLFPHPQHVRTPTDLDKSVLTEISSWDGGSKSVS